MKRGQRLVPSLSAVLILMLLVAGCGGATAPAGKAKTEAPAKAATPAAPAPAAPAKAEPAAPAKAAAAAPAEAPGKAFPQQPIRLVVGLAAGGSTDLVARLFAPYAKDRLGQPLVVENMTGASGTVAMNFLWEAKPDGHTLLMSFVETLTTNKINFKDNAKYDPLKFTPIYNVSGDDFVGITVGANSPYQNLKDLVAAFQAGKVGSVASTGGTTSLAVAFLMKDYGKKFAFVPFDSTGDVANKVTGNQVEVGLVSMSIAGPAAKEGRLKVLAVLGSQRHPYYSDYPSATELGYPNLVLTQNAGIYGPPNLPEPVVRTLTEAFVKTGQDADLVGKMNNARIAPRPKSGGEFQAMNRDINAKIMSVADVFAAMAKK